MIGLEQLLPRISKFSDVQTVDPAAGSEIAAVTVPAGKTWVLLGACVALVQGITQAPWPSLVIDDGTNVVHRYPSGLSAQNASVTAQHTWAPEAVTVGGGAGVASVGTLSPLELLLPGWRVRTLTAGIGANSDYGPMTLFYVEYGT